MKNTPVFITTKDRLIYLKKLLSCLMGQGYGNLHIVDTGSTYPPMVEFLESCSLPVHRTAPTSEPQLAVWNCHIVDGSGKLGGFYVVTDCDVIPEGPDDWLERLGKLLNEHPEFPKAGLALRIDDLPDHYARKLEVVEWEGQFWKKVLAPDVYDAAIDTTLALYRPNVKWGHEGTKAIRLGGAYTARHLPWYENSGSPSEEETYYKAHMQPGVGHWR